MFFKNQRMKEAFEQMKDALFEAAYQKVAQKLIEEAKKNQEQINKQLIDKLEGWDEEIRNRIKEIIQEEMKNKKGD